SSQPAIVPALYPGDASKQPDGMGLTPNSPLAPSPSTLQVSELAIDRIEPPAAIAGQRLRIYGQGFSESVRCVVDGQSTACDLQSATELQLDLSTELAPEGCVQEIGVDVFDEAGGT